MTKIIATTEIQTPTQLLSAAARGARVECRYTVDLGMGKGKVARWAITSMVCTVRGLETYRIHPDDSDLRFGFVSSVIFKSAEDISRHFKLFEVCPSVIERYVSKQDKLEFADCKNSFKRSMYALMLAEALSHDGL
jgi:hypothetical protein